MAAQTREQTRRMQAAALTLVCVAGARALISNLREPPLLERATRVTFAADWNHAIYDKDVTAYWWLSDHEVLSYRTLPPIPGRRAMEFFRRDVITQHETALPALDRRLSAYRWANHMELSPDGAWLLWGGPEEGSQSIAVRLDGSAMFKAPLNPNSSPHWLNGGRHWVNLVMNWDLQQWVRGDIYDNAAPQQPPRRVAIKQPNRSGHGWVFISPDGRMQWVSKWQSGNDGSDHEITFSEAGFDANPLPRQEHTLLLPPGAHVRGYLASPDGRHIAWLLTILSKPALATLLERVFPKLAAATERSASLWVSRNDGKDFHEIGTIPETAGNRYHASIWSVRWLPDGKKLSFLHGDALYTVPAQ